MNKTVQNANDLLGTEFGENPLLDFYPKNFNSFDGWLKAWNDTSYTDSRIGLLHCLIEDRWEQYDPEIVLFLLKHADGYGEVSNFKQIDKGDSGRAPERQKIAKKAFSVLCLKTFKETTPECGLPWWVVHNKEVFETLVCFAERNAHAVYKKDRHEKVFKEFLLKLVLLGWEKHHSPEISKLLFAARPRFIQILYDLGEISLLNRERIRFDEMSLKKLRELSFCKKLFFPSIIWNESYEMRLPNNLEEAVSAGSKVAELLHLYLVREGVRKPLQALRDKSIKEHEEDEKERKLEEMEKQKAKLETEINNLNSKEQK